VGHAALQWGAGDTYLTSEAMIGLPSFLAPLAMMLSLQGVEDPDRNVPVPAAAASDPEIAVSAQGAPALTVFESILRSGVRNQVRIEQRLILRVAPASPLPRQNLMAPLPDAQQAARFEEKRMGECVPVRGIVGVQALDKDRLMLVMRDRNLIGASLEKACTARDFYSGFYLEGNRDGLLCVGRDKLQSRSGANCHVSRFRQLIAPGG